MSNITTKRLDLVDALRGFALLAIVLVHNLEHYNLYYTPDFYPPWLQSLDKGVWDATWFVIAGKAFSTFSLLFGFSFFIQLNNQQQRGRKFGWRFAWRMLLLIVFAQIHAIFYNGDILLMYGFMGLLLIPTINLSNKTIVTIATILLLQPLEWGRIIFSSFDLSYIPSLDLWKVYAVPCAEAMRSGTFIETVKSNLTDGQLYNNLWQVSAGRPFQIPALFMFGVVLGRLQYFVKSEKSVKFWIRVAVISVAMLLFPLNILKNYMSELISNKEVLMSYDMIFLSLWNFAFMAALVSCFALLWFHKGDGYKVQRFIIPYGKMSLTNYITQSIIGCGIYLNWGAGLYKYTGATSCIIIAILIFLVQYKFSKWWLSKHKQGALEWLWKKATWI